MICRNILFCLSWIAPEQQKNLELYNKASESWAKQKNKALTKNLQWRKSNFKASWSTYLDRLQDCIKKNEFAINHGVRIVSSSHSRQ
jgi:hypothetical protein